MGAMKQLIDEMGMCDIGHARIVHTEVCCPVCDDYNKKDTEICRLHDEIVELGEKVIQMRSVISHLRKHQEKGAPY